MWCDGEELEIPPKMEVFQDQFTSIDAQEYYEDKEYRLFMCLKHKKCN